jgi:DNA mismatch repair protein MutL
MPRIRQLPAAVVAQIAAGEVVERPASALKELLENSVDAGARRIDIEVDQGGTELLRVVDDGCGIEPDDLPLTFASHATSKLANADDLVRIATLGFRGEALASIGGVAQVTLQSRPHDQTTGAEITCHGGAVGEVKAWNGAPGTRVEVRHLFYNTPARRKFLRTIPTEMGHVAEAFTRLALARCELHLTLRHNGKHVYEVPASADLLQRLGLFFGTDVRDRLYSLSLQQGPYTIRGFIANPECERGSAKMQYLFVNGRCIRDRSLGHAIQEGYRGLLMTGRYAIAFLFLEMPPELVDVNVHPTKTEVRFREGNALYHLVFNAIRQRLQQENLTAKLRVPSTLNAPQQPAVSPTFPHFEAPAPSPRSNDRPLIFPSAAAIEDQLDSEAEELSQRTADDQAQAAPMPVRPPTIGDLKAIQLYDSYLVLETPEGMMVIDQHALHERILFEQFKERLRIGALESQQLLIPEPVELGAEQAARTLEHASELADLGIVVSDFGGGTVLLTSYPALFGHKSPKEILKAVVDHLLAKDRLPGRDQLFNDLLSLMACHAAVRAGERLTPEQIAALISRRELANDAHHCPHGRPTALLFSRQDLERQFRRT